MKPKPKGTHIDFPYIGDISKSSILRVFEVDLIDVECEGVFCM
jgi:hypothetical protein